jgi:hypothetical protein
MVFTLLERASAIRRIHAFEGLVLYLSYLKHHFQRHVVFPFVSVDVFEVVEHILGGLRYLPWQLLILERLALHSMQLLQMLCMIHLLQLIPIGAILIILIVY